MAAASRALGVRSDSMFYWVGSAAGDQEKLDAIVRERAGGGFVGAIRLTGERYEWRGKWYASRQAFVAAVDCPFVTVLTIKEATAHRRDIYDTIAQRVALARRLRVGDRQFRTRQELAEWLERPLRWVRTRWEKHGEFAEDLAAYCGKWTRPERRESARGTRGGQAVTWSGWRWRSRTAFAFYYFDIRQPLLLRRVAWGELELWQAMIERLPRLYELGRLDRRNRRLDEDRLPAWVLPVNPDDREPVTDWHEQQCTPDLAVLGAGGEHSFDTARRELEERGAALRRLHEQRAAG
jgi:hypothetical protein